MAFSGERQLGANETRPLSRRMPPEVLTESEAQQFFEFFGDVQSSFGVEEVPGSSPGSLT